VTASDDTGRDMAAHNYVSLSVHQYWVLVRQEMLKW
jgi:hypothetical protein